MSLDICRTKTWISLFVTVLKYSHYFSGCPAVIVKVITVWNLVTIWQNFWLFLYVAHYLFPPNYRTCCHFKLLKCFFLHWKVYYDIHNYVISFPLCMSYSYFVSWHMFVFRVQVKCPCEVCNFACLSCIECKMTLWWKKKKWFC